MLRLLVLILLVGCACSAEFNGNKLYEIVPETREQCDLLYELSQSSEYYDFFNLKKLPGRSTLVQVDSQGEFQLLELLKTAHMPYKVITNDLNNTPSVKTVGKHIISKYKKSTERGLSTETYHEYSEILEYLNELSARYPTRVSVKTVGTSFEGRLVKTITVTNGDGHRNKNVIFVDGGMHAREWISPAEILYLLEQLVENYEENADLLKDYDWIILPVINPDGYDYSRTTYRMWRKTRKPYLNCIGTDPNRNFDVHWMENGASTNPCAETYAGPKAFSEPETMILRDVLHSIKQRGTFYLTLHSYGNYLLYPWGYTGELPAGWKDLDDVAQAGATAIAQATGTKYTVGSTTHVLYEAAGGSDDYAYSIGFNISITMELPGAGLTGFHPPERRINGMVTETWIGIRAMAKKVIEKFSSNNMN